MPYKYSVAAQICADLQFFFLESSSDLILIKLTYLISLKAYFYLQSTPPTWQRIVFYFIKKENNALYTAFLNH